MARCPNSFLVLLDSGRSGYPELQPVDKPGTYMLANRTLGQSLVIQGLCVTLLRADMTLSLSLFQQAPACPI
jgi:hypothetical protein